MKEITRRTLIVIATVSWLVISFSRTSKAQECAPFPSGWVPITKIFYISDANKDGDRLVVGAMDMGTYGIYLSGNLLALPSYPNQKFCGLVEIAPGLSGEAYVPTVPERFGDFSASSFQLYDPVTARFDPVAGRFIMNPFPNNIIPASRLPSPLPWRISSAPVSVAQTVPIVLSVSGAKDSFYTSELTLTNRGSQDAPVKFAYKAAFGEGSGAGNDLVPAGRQLIFSNGIDYLRSIGIPIPGSGDRGGTLTVEFGNLASTRLGSTIVRTATARPEGRAGLAYPSIPKWNALPAGGGAGYTLPEAPVYICGLRQNSSDRSNLAVLHAGKAGDSDVVLRLTLINGDPANPSPLTLPDITLSPGEFRQFNSILASNGLSFANGYVRIVRVSGQAPYYAYGVINDEVTSDGSFVPPVVPAQTSTMAIPSMVEAGSFTSELIATNFSTGQTRILFEYVADAIQSVDSTARFEMTLRPGEQIIIPNFVQWLREMKVPGVGTAGAAFAGALFATTDPVSGAAGIFLGARTSSLTSGGRYGLFYTAVRLEEMADETAWLYGLQQNAENRTNLALVAAGVADSNPDVFRVELFDGDTGNKAATIDGITVNAKGWKQIGAILAGNAPGTTNAYAKITRTQGKNPFIAYAVINDGAQPGERTGDGAFVSMQEESVFK